MDIYEFITSEIVFECVAKNRFTLENNVIGLVPRDIPSQMSKADTIAYGLAEITFSLLIVKAIKDSVIDKMTVEDANKIKNKRATAAKNRRVKAIEAGTIKISPKKEKVCLPKIRRSRKKVITHAVTTQKFADFDEALIQKFVTFTVMKSGRFLKNPIWHTCQFIVNEDRHNHEFCSNKLPENWHSPYCHEHFIKCYQISRALKAFNGEVIGEYT